MKVIWRRKIIIKGINNIL